MKAVFPFLGAFLSFFFPFFFFSSPFAFFALGSLAGPFRLVVFFFSQLASQARIYRELYEIGLASKTSRWDPLS